MFTKKTLKKSAKKMLLLLMALSLLSSQLWNLSNASAFAADSKDSTKKTFEQWVQDSKGLWIGITAPYGVFEEGSKFYVERNDKNKEATLKMLDSNIKEKVEQNNILLFNIGVTKPNGEKYTKLSSSATIYVEQPRGWDYGEIKSVLLSQFKDSEFDGSLVQIDPTNTDAQVEYSSNGEISATPYGDGSRNFIRFSINEFKPLAIYDELTFWDYAENYAWVGALLILAIGACVIIYLRVRKKNPIA